MLCHSDNYPTIVPARMPCGVPVPDAPPAALVQWLARVGTHLHLARQTLTSVAHALLSFESLVLLYLLFFLFIGATLSALLLWSIIAEDDNDDYDACERGRGVYYADEGGDGRRWVPVILVDRNRPRPMKRPSLPMPLSFGGPAPAHDPPRAGKRQ
ncbi:hypothetical protein C8R46DRAFT_1078069 [Mycena filopes]|nr:hypothetical protein C8R46DRAFT_1078069 [Mycena filopes]